MSHEFVSSNHAGAGLLTVPQAVQETYGRLFRRGRETRAEQARRSECGSGDPFLCFCVAFSLGTYPTGTVSRGVSSFCSVSTKVKSTMMSENIRFEGKSRSSIQNQ